MSEDRCVICGSVIPEGRQICSKCEIESNYNHYIVHGRRTNFTFLNDYEELARYIISPFNCGRVYGTIGLTLKEKRILNTKCWSIYKKNESLYTL